jgi:hypothetical protein
MEGREYPRVDRYKEILTAFSITYHIFRAVDVLFFFSGEVPRSGRYGRTAAMSLIVQPCDEDDDDYYFLSFS